MVYYYGLIGPRLLTDAIIQLCNKLQAPILNANNNFKVGPRNLYFVGRPISVETYATWLIRLCFFSDKSCALDAEMHVNGIDSMLKHLTILKYLFEVKALALKPAARF